MENLITEIFDLLKDYRSDEILPTVKMTKARIKQWIEQFEEKDRIFILTELKHIFSQYYCSKASAKEFLKEVVDTLTKDLGFKSVPDFLRVAVFLDLQPKGKSQKVLLKLLGELLTEKYHFNIKDCGSLQKKHFVYIDDILCTGNTLIRDIKEWSENKYDSKKTNLQAINDKSASLIFTYIFIHEKNYQKKKAEFKFKISQILSDNHTLYWRTEIENNQKIASSALDLIFPLETTDKEIIAYKDKIITETDEHTKSHGYSVSLRPTTSC